MVDFPNHTPESAPEPANQKLAEVKKGLGFVPNLYAKLAEAPAALEGYTTLSGIYDKTSFSNAERQVILLAASVENGCEFCVAAHSMTAKRMAKVPEDVVEAIRESQTLPDARLNALVQFTRQMVVNRGWMEEQQVQAFLDAGFTGQNALEVVLAVAMKTLSNYANHLTGTKTNEQFASEAWHRH